MTLQTIAPALSSGTAASATEAANAIITSFLLNIVLAEMVMAR